MATILAFPPSRPDPSGTSAPRVSSAELIFFPGVRYERAEPQAATRTRGRRRQNQHDRIELPDRD